MVAVAQLVRAPGCGPGGRGFKSLQPPNFQALDNPRAFLRLLSQLLQVNADNYYGKGSWPMGEFFFDFTNFETTLFLLAYSFTPEMILSGSVDTEVLRAHNIDPTLLKDIANYENDETHNYLSPQEAEWGFSLASSLEERFQSLVSLSSCPSDNAALTLWRNYAGDPLDHFFGVPLEQTCSLSDMTDAGFSLGEMRGIYFSEDRLSPFWQVNVEPVVPIMRNQKGSGTGNIVSREGHIITAAHVLLNSSTGQLEENLTVFIQGREYPIQGDNVMAIDVASDLAIIHIPDIADPHLPYLPLASINSSMEEVGLVGYPALETDFGNEEGSAIVPTKVLTFGQIQDRICVRRDEVRGLLTSPLNHAQEGSPQCPPEDHVFIRTSVESQPGFSGGPLLNVHGQILGIHSHPGHESSVDPRQTNHPQIKALLDSILTLQHSYSAGHY